MSPLTRRIVCALVMLALISAGTSVLAQTVPTGLSVQALATNLTSPCAFEFLSGGRVLYTAPGVPDLAFELEETAAFDGERIRRLEDRYDPETLRAIEAYLGEHGAKLGIES